MSSLASGFDALVCDLDGVVYAGARAVEHAVASLNELSTPLVFATNNASRTPQEVHDHLASLGVPLEPGDVVTSAMAGARRLAELLDPGSRVLAVGGQGVRIALEDAGLRPVAAGEESEPCAAVLQGYGPQVAWTDLAEAAYAVAGGARWVATNLDLTIPTARGIAPGNGTLVGAVRTACGIDPEVVGKPEPPLYLVCADLLDRRPDEVLAIGDRLDTDVLGASRAGMDSLFVLTGVHRALDVVRADAAATPTYLAADLRDLHRPYATAHVEHSADATLATCEDARVRMTQDTVEFGAGGTVSHRLRVVVAAGRRRLEDGSGLPPWDGVEAWIEDGE